MSYTGRSAKLDYVKQMVEVIIDRDNVLDLGVQCHKLKKTRTYAIGFNTIAKNAKLAAGLYTFIHCLCIALF